MRVFLDTNVVASATATRGLCEDVLRTVIERHDLVVSDVLVKELQRVLRDKFRASPELIAEVVWLLRQDATEASSAPLADIPLRDAADIAMVSSALNGSADIFVTGDREIVNLKTVKSMRILTPRQFWDREQSVS